ncbi:oxidoreductase, partial [Streptomyces rimosus]
MRRKHMLWAVACAVALGAASTAPVSAQQQRTAARAAAAAQAAAQPAAVAALRGGWDLKDSDSDARFRGLAAVSRDTAWVAGTGGTVLRTRDGGDHWRDVSPPGAGTLEFRD